MLKISLFGTPRLMLDDQPIKLARRKALGLLCYLALKSQPVSRDILATLLWGDFDQERARAELRVSLWNINKAVGEDWLIVSRDAVQLDPSKPIWVDVMCFQQAVQASSTHQHHPDEICVACLPNYEEAYGLYTDDFLAGFSIANCPEFDDWQLMMSESLRVSYLHVLKKLVIGNSALERWDDGIRYAQLWLKADPFSEEAYRYLMMLQIWSGNKVGALQSYQQCEKILADELAVPPSEETKMLYENIKMGTMPELPTIYYDLPDSSLTTPHNLPPQPNPFRGRGAEVAKLADNLQDNYCRLVTITGLGGTGKTRLALHVAQHMLPQFADGVFFVSLVGTTSDNTLVTDIADAIGFQFTNPTDQQAQLFSYLAPQNMLIILDNFEHLLAHTAFVEQLLAHAPKVKLLVTSRTPLNLKAEWVFTLDQMTEGAEELFIDSAQRVNAHFDPSPEDKKVVQYICECLAGMPLAIELAATWVLVLSLEQIVAEIKRSVVLLDTHWSDIPERHRSLQATFDYSWGLLTPPHQKLLAQLAIFPSSFSYEGAKAITDVSINALSHLAVQSFIKRNAQGRYELHPIIRQFALEKLVDDYDRYLYQNIVHQFIQYFNQFLADKYQSLRSEAMLQTKNVILQEMDSIREAYTLALQKGKLDLLLDSLNSLATFYEYQSWYAEGKALFEEISYVLPENHLFSIRAKINLGRFYRLLGDLDNATRVLTQAIGSAKSHPQELALAYLQMAHVEFYKSTDQAIQYTQKALDIYEEINDRLGQGVTFRVFASIYSTLGTTEETIVYAQKGITLLAPFGKVPELASIYGTLALVYIHRGDFDSAVTYGKQSVELYELYDFKDQIVSAKTTLAGAQNRTGDYENAKAILEEAIAMARHFQLEQSLVYALMEYGTNAYYSKDYPTAADALEQSIHLSQKLQMGIIASFLKSNLAKILVELKQYTRAETLSLESLNEHKARDNAYGIVGSSLSLAIGYIATQRYMEAQHHLQKAILLAHQNTLVDDWLSSILQLGIVYFEQGNYEIATRLIVFVLNHESTNSDDRQLADEYHKKIITHLGKSQAMSFLANTDTFDVQTWLEGLKT